MSYLGIPNAAAQAEAQARAAVTRYINAANQYNAANILGGGSYMGSGGGTGNFIGSASGIGVGGYAYPQVTTAAYPIPIQSATTLTNPGHNHGVLQMLPAPTGQVVSITVRDMNGLLYSLDVDLAYAPILQAISQQHQHMAACRPSQGFAAPKMLEGDFSEDEMSQAEQIIQEMGNGPQKQPCECEA